MSSRVIAGQAVDFNDEGFMTNPNEWTREVAVELASEEGVPELTSEHWKVIEFCRSTAGASGKSPTLRQISTGSGVTTKELFALFPKGPAKKVARISGLGKPEGCV